jgi:hypothetical protein
MRDQEAIYFQGSSIFASPISARTPQVFP